MNHREPFDEIPDAHPVTVYDLDVDGATVDAWAMVWRGTPDATTVCVLDGPDVDRAALLDAMRRRLRADREDRLLDAAL